MNTYMTFRYILIEKYSGFSSKKSSHPESDPKRQLSTFKNNLTCSLIALTNISVIATQLELRLESC